MAFYTNYLVILVIAYDDVVVIGVRVKILKILDKQLKEFGGLFALLSQPFRIARPLSVSKERTIAFNYLYYINGFYFKIQR